MIFILLISLIALVTAAILGACWVAGRGERRETQIPDDKFFREDWQ